MNICVTLECYSRALNLHQMKGRIQNDKNVYYDIIKPDNSEMLCLYDKSIPEPVTYLI